MFFSSFEPFDFVPVFWQAWARTKRAPCSRQVSFFTRTREDLKGSLHCTAHCINLHHRQWRCTCATCATCASSSTDTTVRTVTSSSDRRHWANRVSKLRASNSFDPFLKEVQGFMDSNLLRNHVFRSVDSVDVFQSYAHSTQDGTSRHVSSPNWSESKHWHLTLQMQRFVKVSKCQTQTPTFSLGTASRDTLVPKVWQMQKPHLNHGCCSLSARISQSCPFFCLRPPTGFGISNATSIATATQQEEAITYCHDPSSHKVHRVMQCSTTTNKMSKVIDPQMDVQSILFRNLVTMVSCTNKVNTYQYWRDLAER